MLLNSALKLVARDQLEKLGEDATYSIHGGGLRSVKLVQA
jgi:hypothetical protein